MYRIIKRNYYIKKLKISKPYNNERKEYEIMKKDFLSKNREEYLETKNQMENNFLNKFLEGQKNKKLNDEIKFRSFICKSSLHDQKVLIQQENKLIKKNEINKRYYIKKQLEKANRKRIIEIMKAESITWLNNEDLDNKINNYLLIPNISFNQTDYYVKLQERTMFHESGNYEDLDSTWLEEETIAYKNSKLIPKYAIIRNIIRQLKLDNQTKLLCELEYSTILVEKSNISEEEKNLKITKLNKIYEKLIKKVQIELEKPDKKFLFLEEKLLLIYNLLHNWQKYISIANLSSQEIKTMQDYEDNVEQFLEENDENDDNVMDKHFNEVFNTNDNINLNQDNDLNLNDLYKKFDDFDKNNNNFDKNFNITKDEINEDYKVNTTEKTEKDMIIESINKEFKENQPLNEYNYIKDKIHENDLYGDSEFQKNRSNQYLDDLKLEQLFSESFLKEFIEEDKILRFKNLNEIKKDSNINSKYNVSQLNTNLFVELFKDKFLELKEENKNNNKYKNKINDLLYIIEKIGNIPVEEPELLAKIISRVNIY